MDRYFPTQIIQQAQTCEHNILMDNGLEVCRECGEIVGEYYDIKYPRSYYWGEPMSVKIYTHNIRFKKLLSRLLMLSSPPPTKVIVYVKSKKPKNIKQIRAILRKSSFKTKYYEYMSFFGNYLLDYTFPPLEEYILNDIYVYFAKVSDWGKEKTGKKIFCFPYPYILRKIFGTRPDISRFLNRLKCAKRRKKYDILWNEFNKTCEIPGLKRR